MSKVPHFCLHLKEVKSSPAESRDKVGSTLTFLLSLGCMNINNLQLSVTVNTHFKVTYKDNC